MINLEVWLYGELAKYGGEHKSRGHARLDIELSDGATMADLLELLNLPIEEKGLTFINGTLTDMPGLAADLSYVLQNRDRVAIFCTVSAWPFQYRMGAATSPELQEAMNRAGSALHHDFRQV